ncbi:GGDEF domain-containing protein [Oxalobacteraceae bacterium OM1]|nr:GGDEF domain-containing protein [Oxalobacteraceae bacterium OM1]
MLSTTAALLAASLLCFIMFLVVYALRGYQIRGVSELLLANALGTMAFLSYAAVKQAPELFAFEGANALYASAGGAAYVGFRRLFKREVSLLLVASGVLLLVASVAWFHYVAFSFTGRTIAISIYQAGVAAGIAWTAWRCRSQMLATRYPAYLTAGIALAVCAGHALRGTGQLLSANAPISLLAPTGWNILALTPGALALPALTLAGLVVAHRAVVEGMEQAANRDFLTDALSRRAVFGAAERELARALRTRAPLALVLIDLDNMKRINDSFGHAVGDDVLVRVVRTARAALRNMDYIGRLGGDEFVVLMPDTDLPAAMTAAERLKRQLDDTEAGAAGAAAASFSMGVATLQAGDTLAALMQRADAALYAAKAEGRDRIVARHAAATSQDVVPDVC